MRQDDYPRPVPDADSEPFWRFCQDRQLRIQRCTACGLHRHHPRPRCPRCRSSSFVWARCRGTGVVHTFTICHPPVLPAFEARAPYNVVVVQLAEGPFMVSNVVDSEDPIYVGMPVEVCFREIDEALTIPQFRPRSPVP